MTFWLILIQTTKWMVSKLIDYNYYQKQLDFYEIPVDIRQFGVQPESVIKCIMGGLLMFAKPKVMVNEQI